MKESEYQLYLSKEIIRILPGRELVDTFVFINDPQTTQGIHDLLVIHRGRFALLEVKLSEKSKKQPNQQWYVDNWAQWTFSSFIYPENQLEVLLALQSALAG